MTDSYSDSRQQGGQGDGGREGGRGGRGGRGQGNREGGGFRIRLSDNEMRSVRALQKPSTCARPWQCWALPSELSARCLRRASSMSWWPSNAPKATVAAVVAMTNGVDAGESGRGPRPDPCSPRQATTSSGRVRTSTEDESNADVEPSTPKCRQQTLKRRLTQRIPPRTQQPRPDSWGGHAFSRVFSRPVPCIWATGWGRFATGWISRTITTPFSVLWICITGHGSP